MKKIRVTLLLNFLVTVGVITVLIIFAQHAYPASSLYTLKRVGENLQMMTKLSDSEKADYFSTLSRRRFTEIEEVYTKEQYQHILITSLRYVATTGNATEFIFTHSLTSEGNKLKKMMTEDIVRFEKMRANLPEENEDGRFLTDAINYTNANVHKLESL